MKYDREMKDNREEDMFRIYFRQITLQDEEYCSIILIYYKSLMKDDRERKDNRERDIFRIYFRKMTFQAESIGC